MHNINFVLVLCVFSDVYPKGILKTADPNSIICFVKKISIKMYKPSILNSCNPSIYSMYEYNLTLDKLSTFYFLKMFNR